MNYQESHAAFIAKRAETLNLDKLLSVFVVENDAKEMRRDLMDVYFSAVNAMTSNNECAGKFGVALVTLQNIIEAVDVMEDTDKKYLGIKTL